MSQVTKIGDICVGVCPAHGGLISFCSVLISGAATVLVDGQACGNLTSIGASSCGHPTVAISGSSTVLAEGFQVHRIGDIDVNPGSGTVVSGSPDVDAGD